MVREAQALNAAAAKRMVGHLPLLPVSTVVAGAIRLLSDATVGPALILFQNGSNIEWPSKRRIELPAAQARL